MQIVHSIEALGAALGWRQTQRLVGLVTTKGNLHAGNLGVIKACCQSAEVVVVTVCAHPLEQARLPNHQHLVAKLEQLGVDYLFAPSQTELFPRGSKDVATVRLPRLAVELQARNEPWLFNARATLWLKLYHIVRPQIAYIGEKDAQEFVLLQQLIEDLNLPVALHCHPMVRDAENVAISAGLSALSHEARGRAPVLAQTLTDMLHALGCGARNFARLEQTARLALRSAGFTPDYVALRDADTLQPPAATSQRVRILAAARLGSTQLRDTMSASF